MSCNTIDVTGVLAAGNSIVQDVSKIAPETGARVFLEYFSFKSYINMQS